MKTRLGRQETMLLAYAQMRKLRTLRTGDLTEPLQLSRAQERELFRRLAQGGLIARVRPGLFLVPPRLPLGGAWTPNEAEALNALMQDVKGRYQICGANTFNRCGFDDQISTCTRSGLALGGLHQVRSGFYSLGLRCGYRQCRSPSGV